MSLSFDEVVIDERMATSFRSHLPSSQLIILLHVIFPNIERHVESSSLQRISTATPCRRFDTRLANNRPNVRTGRDAHNHQSTSLAC